MTQSRAVLGTRVPRASCQEKGSAVLRTARQPEPVPGTLQHEPPCPTELIEDRSDRGDDVWSYIVKRTQIYLDEEQDRILAARAVDTGRTKSQLIREAIDTYLGRSDMTREQWRPRWLSALETTHGVAPYIPPSQQMRADRQHEAAEREQMLAEHWRR